MSKVYIKNFKEGLRIEEPLLVVAVSKGLTNAGATYLNVEFQDNSGTIDAKVWDAKESDIEVIAPGNVVFVNGDVLLYRNNLQLRVNKADAISEENYNIEDYLKASPIDREALQENVYAYVEQIENEVLYKITKKIVVDNEKDYFTYPAASRIHHEFVGGLATHVLGMLRIAENICDQHAFINRSLLYSGIILDRKSVV